MILQNISKEAIQVTGINGLAVNVKPMAKVTVDNRIGYSYLNNYGSIFKRVESTEEGDARVSEENKVLKARIKELETILINAGEGIPEPKKVDEEKIEKAKAKKLKKEEKKAEKDVKEKENKDAKKAEATDKATKKQEEEDEESKKKDTKEEDEDWGDGKDEK